MVLRLIKLGLCLALVFCVGGCMFARARTNVRDFHKRAEQVEPGKTRTSELLEIVGSPPNNIIDLPGGKRLFIYTFGDSKTGGFNIVILGMSFSDIGVDSAIFIIDPNGVLKTAEIHDLGIGRSAAEALRKLEAAKLVHEHGDQVCPANWKPGADTLQPGLDLVGKI